MNYLIRLLNFTCAVGLLILCSSALAATNFVSIKDSTFIPDRLAIYPGDTVTWTQDDNVEHSVTSQEGVFNSGGIAPGEAFTWTFNDKGDFAYFCVFHGAGAMAGVINVAEPTDNTPPLAPTNAFPPNNATNQPLALQLVSAPFSDAEATDFHGASQWVVRLAGNQAVVADSGPVSGGNLTAYSPEGLIEETTYAWQARHKDGRGAWSEYSTPTLFTTLAAFKIPGVGLRGAYHAGADFTNALAVMTNAAISFDWGKTRPHRRITGDDFAVRWEGAVLPKYSELYQFEFEFRGQARVWVNNQLLIDDWTRSPFISARRGAVRLAAGQLAPLRVEYAAGPAGGLSILRWMSPSVPAEVVPMARLYPAMP